MPRSGLPRRPGSPGWAEVGRSPTIATSSPEPLQGRAALPEAVTAQESSRSGAARQRCAPAKLAHISRRVSARTPGAGLITESDVKLSLPRLIRAAGFRWPAEESFEFSKDCFGLDQSQVRLYTAIARHTVLVMAALAICAVTAASLRHRTDTRAPVPSRPDQPPPANPGMIPLTIPETGRLLAHPPPRQAAARGLDWRHRHQAHSAWYHQRTRLAQDAEIAQVRY
jgi:hypothetical protein